MFEFLLELLGEFLLQMILEILFEMGLHTLKEPFHKDPSPIVATIGYMMLGAISGGLSLFVLPALVVTSTKMRIVNLLVTPIIAGFFMSVVGSWRRRRGQNSLRIDKFAYGYVFALSCALIRFWFAK
ncbi:MAG: hypothetical protein V4525_16515 [Pseudomonadota bacterium]